MFPFYPLKALENLWFSGVFRGGEMGTLARNELMVRVTCGIKNFHKQSFTDVQYKCSSKFGKFHRKTPVLECFSVKFLITLFLQNSCGGSFWIIWIISTAKESHISLITQKTLDMKAVWQLNKCQNRTSQIRNFSVGRN